MPSLWPLGISIYIAGTVGEALGANLQRKSLTETAEAARVQDDNNNDERERENQPHQQPGGKFQQRLWRIGFFLFVGAGIGTSAALFFTTQTVLAPLQLFLFVSNAFFANVINKEPFTWLGWDGLTLVLVVVGVSMAIVAAPKHSSNYSNEEMMWLMHQPGFIIFCCLAGTFIIGMWCIKRRILALCKHEPRNIQRRWLRTFLNMSYGSIAGAFGGVNVTLTKTVFSLIVGQYQHGGIVAVLSSPVLYATAIVLIGTYVLQIVVTVSGLEVTSAIIIISAHSVTEEVMVTSGGILYFQDYLSFEVWSWIVFFLGNLLAIASVIGLSHRRLLEMEAKEQDSPASTVISIPDEEEMKTARKRATSDGYLVLKQNREKRKRMAGSLDLPFGDENPEDTLGPRNIRSSTSFRIDETGWNRDEIASDTPRSRLNSF